MSAFVVAALLLGLLAMAFVWWPLFGRVAGGAMDLERERQALQDLARRGVLEGEALAEARRRLAARWLDAEGPAVTPRPAIALALLLSIVVPLATLLTYRHIGSPAAVGLAAPARSGGEAPHDLAKAADELAAQMQARPDDVEGWRLLGRTYRSLERFAEARDALKRAIDLRADDPDVLAEYAEMLGLSADPRSLLGEPERLLDRALAADPDNQRALWLKGFARQQDGDEAAALVIWERLLAAFGTEEAPPQLVEQVAALRARSGSPSPAPSPPVPSPAAAAPAETASERVQVSVRLSPDLAARVRPDQALFVFARADGGPPMPLAVTRLTAGQLPTTVELTEAMGMIEGLKLSSFPRLLVGARVSLSGQANPSPGDLEGFSAAFDRPRVDPVEVVIDRVRQ